MSFLQGFTQNDDFQYDSNSKRSQRKNLTEFASLEQSYNNARFYIGTEHIRIFKQKSTSKNRYILNTDIVFLCEVCQEILKPKEKVFPHLASYTHIFRHTKKLYPNEFDIINTGLEGMLEKKIKAILSLNKVIKLRAVGIDIEPKEHECDNVENEFQRELQKIKYQKRLDRLDDEIELLNKNWEEEDKIDQNKLGKKSSHSSQFLTRFMQEDELQENEDDEMSDEHTGRFNRDRNENHKIFSDFNRSSIMNNELSDPCTLEYNRNRDGDNTIFSRLKIEKDTNDDCSKAKTSHEKDIIVDETQSSLQVVLKKEINNEDLGYTTDDLLSEKDMNKFLHRFREKALHICNNKLTPSDEFKKELNLQMSNLKLTQEESSAIYKHIILDGDDCSDDDDSF